MSKETKWPHWREQTRMTAHAWRRRPRAWDTLLAVLLAGLLRGVVVLALAYASGSLKMVGWRA